MAEAAVRVGLSISESPPQLHRPVGFSSLTGVMVAFEPHGGGSDQNRCVLEPLNHPGGFGFRIVVEQVGHG